MGGLTACKPRVGLLPLYIALYDRAVPAHRSVAQRYAHDVQAALEKAGMEVRLADICTVRGEFERAVTEFELNEVDMIVTLHLAYSPSGESADALARTRIPILMLDTTPQYDFGPRTDPAGIMSNHGIHGVQDLASVLRRRGRTFAIEAGHLIESDVLERAKRWAAAAQAARRLQKAIVGRIGAKFEGMDDFAVEPELLRTRLGLLIKDFLPAELAPLVPAANSDAVRQEIALDRDRFDASDVAQELHVASVRAGLALRQLVERERLTAFTMNFESFTQETGLPTVPFLEASKAMSRGIGYAGENDALTAAFVGALASVFGEVTFTEMFCPDWKGNSIFLSHMGEINFNLAARKPILTAPPYPWANVAPPVIAACSPRPGPAVFANVAPGPQDTFSIILAPVEVLPEPPDSHYAGRVRGWIRPSLTTERFLEEYSRNGGTHHAMLVLGDRLDELQKFAFLLGLPSVVIRGTLR